MGLLDLDLTLTKITVIISHIVSSDFSVFDALRSLPHVFCAEAIRDCLGHIIGIVKLSIFKTI